MSEPYRYEKHGTEFTVTSDYITVGNDDEGYVDINIPTDMEDIRNLLNAILAATGTGIVEIDISNGTVGSLAKED